MYPYLYGYAVCEEGAQEGGRAETVSPRGKLAISVRKTQQAFTRIVPASKGRCYHALSQGQVCALRLDAMQIRAGC